MKHNHDDDNLLSEKINAILPQTQCGLCTFNGCAPYAQALAEKKAAINLCPPGGVTGFKKIAEIINPDPTPFILEMEKNAKPTLRAVIREAECIGCTKCITACPVDAILGSAKKMHTVITDECTGCELCVTPCPVDCIDMVLSTDTNDRKTQYRTRYEAHQKRIQQERKSKTNKPLSQKSLTEKKSYVEAAILRSKLKKKI